MRSPANAVKDPKRSTSDTTITQIPTTAVVSTTSESLPQFPTATTKSNHEGATTWLGSELPDLSSAISTMLPTNEQAQQNDADIDTDLQLLVDGHEDLLSDDTMMKINALLTPEQQHLLEHGSGASCFDPMFTGFTGGENQQHPQQTETSQQKHVNTSQTETPQVVGDKTLSAENTVNASKNKDKENNETEAVQKTDVISKPGLKPPEAIIRRSPRQSSRSTKVLEALKPQVGKAKKAINMKEKDKKDAEEELVPKEEHAKEEPTSDAGQSRRRSGRFGKRDDEGSSAAEDNKATGKDKQKKKTKQEDKNKKTTPVKKEITSSSGDDESKKRIINTKQKSDSKIEKGKDIVNKKKEASTTQLKLKEQKGKGKKTVMNKKQIKKKNEKAEESIEVQKEEKEASGDDEEMSSESDYDEEDDDSDFDPDNDPHKLWCICKRPHGNRFMIMCDKCEEWFHGECVGISMTMGREMEKTGEEWTCSKCQVKVLSEKKVAKGKRIVEREIAREKLKSNDTKHVSSSDSEHEELLEEEKKELLTEVKEITKSHEEAHSTNHKPKHRKSSSSMVDMQLFAEPDLVKSKADSSHRRLSSDSGKSDSSRSATGRRHTADGRVQNFYGSKNGKSIDPAADLPEFPKKSQSNEPRFVIPKRVAKTPTPKNHRAIVPPKECAYSQCKKYALKNAIYCSPACITKHAEESLQFIENERKKRIHGTDNDNSGHGSSKVSSSADVRINPPVSDRIAVIEQTTGRVVAGVMAPSKSRLIAWLEDHPTFEVLKPIVKADVAKRKDKKEQDDIVRKNVKRSIKEILLSRCREVDITIDVDKVAKIASSVEEEMLKLYEDTGQKYKTKYRSLTFNLKDQKNKVLFLRLVKGNITPEEIVRLTPEQLASSELMRWRERETKHNIEMIKKHEEEEAVSAKTIVKKTHKGEVEIDSDNNLSNMDVKMEDADSKTGLTDNTAADSVTPLLLEDTTEQHTNHLFDLNCKICTGKQAPPGETQATTTGGHVTTTVIQAIPESTIPSPTQDSGINASLSPSVIDDFSVPSSSKQVQSTVAKKEIPDWKGFLMMQSVAKFATCAYRVSGACENLLQLLPDTLHICGRISHEQVWDYIFQLKTSHSKEINVLRFDMASEEEKSGYIALYNYFYTRRRIGVVANCYSSVKDMYILPLASHDPIPPELKPFSGPGFPNPRPHMLVGIMIKVKNVPAAGSKRAKAFSQRSPSQNINSSKSKPVVNKSPKPDASPSIMDDIIFQKRTTPTKKDPKKTVEIVQTDVSPDLSPDSTPSIIIDEQKAEIEAEQLKKLEEQTEQLKLLQQQVQQQMTVNLEVSTKLTTNDNKVELDETPYDPEDDFVIDLIEDIPIAKRIKMDDQQQPIANPVEISTLAPISFSLAKSEVKMPELPPIPIPGFPVSSAATSTSLLQDYSNVRRSETHEPVSPPDPSQRQYSLGSGVSTSMATISGDPRSRTSYDNNAQYHSPVDNRYENRPLYADSPPARRVDTGNTRDTYATPSDPRSGYDQRAREALPLQDRSQSYYDSAARQDTVSNSSRDQRPSNDGYGSYNPRTTDAAYPQQNKRFSDYQTTHTDSWNAPRNDLQGTMRYDNGPQHSQYDASFDNNRRAPQHDQLNRNDDRPPFAGDNFDRGAPSHAEGQQRFNRNQWPREEPGRPFRERSPNRGPGNFNRDGGPGNFNRDEGPGNFNRDRGPGNFNRDGGPDNNMYPNDRQFQRGSYDGRGNQQPQINRRGDNPAFQQDRFHDDRPMIRQDMARSERGFRGGNDRGQRYNHGR